MTQNELEQLEKQGKELEDKINEEKNNFLQLEKKKKVLQNLCDSFQLKKAEKLDQLNKLKENNRKMMQVTENEYKKKIQEIDLLIGKYIEPQKRAQFKLNLVRERKNYIENKWVIKENQYLMQLSELKEQINQLRAKINEYSNNQMSEQRDMFSNEQRMRDDPLSAFIPPDMNRMPHPTDDSWKYSFITGNFLLDKFNQEFNEKSDRVKILSEDCRKLHQRKALLIKQLKMQKDSP